jgi:hypothetical protein
VTQTSTAARADGLQREVTELLLERARTEGVSLAGPGGLLSGVTKTVLETALDAEMTECGATRQSGACLLINRRTDLPLDDDLASRKCGIRRRSRAGPGGDVSATRPRVPELLHHGAQVGALKQQEARRRVPQIVNAEVPVSAARLQTRSQRRLTFDTGRVEPRAAEPVDLAIGRDQRGGLQVTDPTDGRRSTDRGPSLHLRSSSAPNHRSTAASVGPG